MAEWYPTNDAALIPWHANFVVECNNYKTTFGTVLTTPVVAQVATNSTFVANVVNTVESAKNWASDMVAFKEIILRGAHGTSMPVTPVAPSTVTVPSGAVAAIEDYTRALVAQIKAHPAFTPAIGQAMGIVAGGSVPGNVSCTAGALTQSQVQVNIVKAGHNVVAVDSKRGTGAWEQISLATSTPYIDARAPLVSGQPEVREYRVQAFENNARVGPLSGIVSVVTVP